MAPVIASVRRISKGLRRSEHRSRETGEFNGEAAEAADGAPPESRLRLTFDTLARGGQVLLVSFGRLSGRFLRSSRTVIISLSRLFLQTITWLSASVGTAFNQGCQGVVQAFKAAKPYAETAISQATRYGKVLSAKASRIVGQVARGNTDGMTPAVLGQAMRRWQTVSDHPVISTFSERRWPKPVLAGGGTAIVLLLFAIFGLDGTGPSARSAVTFLIPDRPIASEVEAVSSKTVISDATALPERPLDGDTLGRIGDIPGVSQFVRAAKTVGLGELLEPGKAYTIFVPHDEAFAKLAPGEFERLMQPAEHVGLITLLSHHIVEGPLIFGGITPGAREYTSLAGQTVTIDAQDGGKIGDAGMIEADLLVEDDVVHVIDTILLPSGP